MNSQEINLTTQLRQVLSTSQAWHYRIIPQDAGSEHLRFLIDECQDVESVREELNMLLGKLIELEKVSSAVIERALSQYYLTEQKPQHETKYRADAAVDSEDFVLELIEEAKSLKSSDIHVERYEERGRIRMRVDGKLTERLILSKDAYPALINKIKILSNLDIAEKRLPQDGRIFFKKSNEKFDIRVSVVPTLHGEKVVMRLLGGDASEVNIQALGFGKDELENYLEGIQRPHGLVLISGPTGSGKTTTLYASLKLLNEASRNILTIEDPIEYTLEGINQVQLRENIGLDFGKALRTFLRQDPDVIMVGEIRDTDTANMAIRAALTGHLVLSTIHTNSAWGTVARLTDMGVPAYLLAGTLNVTVAQRLVRLLCPHCKVETAMEDNLYPKNFRPFHLVTSHYVPKGCGHCFYTGYQGRKAVYEVIPIDQELSEMIREGRLEANQMLKEKKINGLAESAFSLFEEGLTSLEEIYAMLFYAR